MNKSQKAEKNRREEYHERKLQEQIKKNEMLERSLRQLDKVFNFLDLADQNILQAISEKVDPIDLNRILECWNENVVRKESQKGDEFIESIVSDYDELIVENLESAGLLVFKADTLEKVIAFEKFTEEWKNK